MTVKSKEVDKGRDDCCVDLITFHGGAMPMYPFI